MTRTAFLNSLTVVGLMATVSFGQSQGKSILTLDLAKQMAQAATSQAQKNKTGAAIAIVDDGGHLVYLERLDGTFAAGSSVSTGKARTSATFQKPTRVFEEAIKNGRIALTTVPEMTPLQGGVPVVLNGQVIGGVGVSGASSAAQDEEYAMAAAAAVNAPPASTAQTRLFSASEVKEGFSEGAVLLNAGSYQVHTSRRESPGKAEIHTLDTDIFHVLEGQATLVTGGTVPDRQISEPNEYRGSVIEGGQSRTLQPGDVVVIPAGTPHWFKAVKGPVLYMAVKVRTGDSR